MNKTKILDKLSTYAFILGTLASKMQYLPLNMFTPVLSVISLILYLTGYSLWYISSYLKPEQTPKFTEWYGFAPTKEQSSYAAAIGILAMVTSLTALALPLMAIPAAWMIVASNLFWVIGEYHKFKNPPQDKDYNEASQEQFLSYALSIASINLVAAITVTFLFFNPALFIPTLVVSGILTVGLTLTALGYWLAFNFNHEKKAPPANTSYEQMTHDLGYANELSNSNTQAPVQSASLFKAKEDLEEKGIELTTMNNARCSPY
jgi:hypothetical protein